MTDGKQHVIDLVIDIPLREVMRCMGCKGGRIPPGIAATTERLLDEVQPLIQPRGVYRVCKVAGMTETELQLTGWASFHGPIAAFFRPARRVAVCIVTIGNETQELAERRLHAGETFEGYCLHAIGAAAADAAAEAMAEYLGEYEAGPGEDVTLPFSPGYCGMALEEQKTLFSIVDGGAIGVRLWPTCIMEPVKSVSGLIGIGPAEEIIECGIPCQYCDRPECSMRREG